MAPRRQTRKVCWFLKVAFLQFHRQIFPFFLFLQCKTILRCAHTAQCLTTAARRETPCPQFTYVRAGKSDNILRYCLVGSKVTPVAVWRKGNHHTHRHNQLKWMLVDPHGGLVFLHHG